MSIVNYGRLLEVKLHSHLAALGLFDQILHEDELRKNCGWDASSVDHVLVIGDYMIPIQEKWRNTRRRETKNMTRFIQSVYFVSEKMHKKVLFGAWVSRIEPFDDNKEMLQRHKIMSISCYTSIDELVAKVVKEIVGHTAGLGHTYGPLAPGNKSDFTVEDGFKRVNTTVYTTA